jgi:hypothetical protein
MPLRAEQKGLCHQFEMVRRLLILTGHLNETRSGGWCFSALRQLQAASGEFLELRDESRIHGAQTMRPILFGSGPLSAPTPAASKP